MGKISYQLEQDEFGAHQKIINWVGGGRSVLEVGCASGYLSAELKKKKCLVTGIEIDPESARKAKRSCLKVITGDVENHSTIKQLGQARFEIIVLADVLEHFKDPEKTLKNLVGFLKKEGKVIVSVPNVGFLTVRLLHLLGRFNYADWGIMDRTHLRFFTQDSVIRLVEKAGLEVESLDYVANFTQLPFYMQTLYPILGKKKRWRQLEYKITGLWPRGLAIQFLLLCQKK